MAFEKVEPLGVGDDGRLAGRARGREIGRGEGAAHAAPGHQLVDPGQAIEVVAVELAGRGLADDGQDTGGGAPQQRAVRHVGQTDGGQATGAHALREIIRGRRPGDDAGRASVAVDVHGRERSPPPPPPASWPRRSRRAASSVPGLYPGASELQRPFPALPRRHRTQAWVEGAVEPGGGDAAPERAERDPAVRDDHVEAIEPQDGADHTSRLPRLLHPAVAAHAPGDRVL